MTDKFVALFGGMEINRQSGFNVLNRMVFEQRLFRKFVLVNDIL